MLKSHPVDRTYGAVVVTPCQGAHCDASRVCHRKGQLEKRCRQNCSAKRRQASRVSRCGSLRKTRVLSISSVSPENRSVGGSGGCDAVDLCHASSVDQGTLRGQVWPSLSPGAKAISLIEGIDVTLDGCELISGLVRAELGVECSVLMGVRSPLAHCGHFHVTAVPDSVGCELCGTLKNVRFCGRPGPGEQLENCHHAHRLGGDVMVGPTLLHIREERHLIRERRSGGFDHDLHWRAQPEVRRGLRHRHSRRSA